MTGITTASSSPHSSELITVPLSLNDTNINTLTVHLPKEDSSLLPLEPVRFCKVTSTHFLIGLATSVVLVAIGAILLFTMHNNSSANYAGVAVCVTGAACFAFTMCYLDREFT